MEAYEKKKSPYYPVEVGDEKLKVFVVGGDPCIKKRAKTQRTPENMRGVHTHFTYEAFFVTEGSLTLVTEDYSRSFAKRILLIPPQMRHYSLPDAEGSFCLLFSPEEGTKAETVLKNRIQNGVCEFVLEEDVAFYIRRLAQCCEEETANAEREMQLLMALIFHRIWMQLTPQATSPVTPTAGQSHIYAIEQYINRHLKRKLTLSEVAAHVYLSTRQVARIIERECGCRFSEWITAKRLAAAEMLLKNTDMPVAQIAADTLPGAESYFYVLFKKKYGISPLRYRKESRLFRP